MKPYIIYAVIAGLAWGVGGYFEKAALQKLGLPPIAGIALRTGIAFIILGLVSIPAWKSVADPSNTRAWVTMVIAGGIVAGSLGMWAFYAALSTSENLGVTLAIAFALAPLAGTLLGLARGTQHVDLRIAVGLASIILGIALLQTATKVPAR
jgi:transporter family protein